MINYLEIIFMTIGLTYLPFFVPTAIAMGCDLYVIEMVVQVSSAELKISWQKCQDKVLEKSYFDQTFRKFLDIMSDQNIKCPGICHFCSENVWCPTVILSSGSSEIAPE